MRSRRNFLAAAALGAGGVSAGLLAACGGDDDPDARTTAAGGPGDVGVLNSALSLEQIAVAAYAAGVELLEGAQRTLAQRLLEHEREHVAGLTQAIRDLGGEPNQAPASGRHARMLESVRDARGFLRFAIDLETTAVAAYTDLLPKLSVPELRQTAVAVLGAEAQHLAAVRGAAGRPRAPDALVTGEPAR